MDWLQLPDIPGSPDPDPPDDQTPAPDTTDSPPEPAADSPAETDDSSLNDVPAEQGTSLDEFESAPDSIDIPAQEHAESLSLFTGESAPLFPDEPPEIPSDTGPEPEIPDETTDDDTEPLPQLRDETDEAVIDAEYEIYEIDRLQSILSLEFGDTLTGGNAFTLPIGILLLLLSILSWFLEPILVLTGMEQFLQDNSILPRIIAVVLMLAGLHLLFYWTVHRISNNVKSRELDRLIIQRREKFPCRFLDCLDKTEPDEAFEKIDASSELLGDDFPLTDTDLVWQCSLFDASLESSPICAVCDKYKPPDVNSLDSDHEIDIQA